MIQKIKKYIKFLILDLRYSKTNKIHQNTIVGKKVSLTNSALSNYSIVAENASLNNTIVGEYTSIGRYSKITHTIIGKYCAISWDVTINAIMHPVSHLSISAFPYVPYMGKFVEQRKQTYSKVVIKNDVWVGANSVIMPGITIGNGAIIGAGAVVTKNVPDYAVVVGVPAKIIRFRFSEEIIDCLLEIKWWDLNPEVIKSNIDLFQKELDLNAIEKLRKLSVPCD